MSEQAARDFLERMKSDKAFRGRVLAGAGHDERLAFIHAEGYDRTREEIAARAGRLDDRRLQDAIGGSGGCLLYARGGEWVVYCM